MDNREAGSQSPKDWKRQHVGSLVRQASGLLNEDMESSPAKKVRGVGFRCWKGENPETKIKLKVTGSEKALGGG